MKTGLVPNPVDHFAVQVLGLEQWMGINMNIETS